MGEWERANPGRQVVTFEDVRREAAALDPALVAHLKVPKAGETLNPAVRYAARQRVNTLIKEIRDARMELERRSNSERIGVEETMREEARIASMEQDAGAMLDVLIPTRSQDGRNLAYHRMMADSSWDAEYWGSRARRAMGLPPGARLPEAERLVITKILAEGQEAELAAVERLRGRKRTAEEKIARGVKGAEADTRPPTPEERQAVQADPAVRAARIELAKTMMRLERSGILDTITALRKAGLLTGVKTALRNVGGNTAFQVMEEAARVPAAVLDAAMSVFTGRRTVQGASPTAVARASYRAATKGIREAAEVMRHGATSEQLARMDLVKEVNSGNRIIDAYANTVFRFMSAQDRVFRRYAIERSLQEQARLMERNGMGRAEDLLKNPTAEMQARAVADAEFATFNNENLIAGALGQARAWLRRHGPAGKAGAFVTDLAIPFARTPANIVSRVLDYTPVGAVGRASAAAELVAPPLRSGSLRSPSLRCGAANSACLTGNCLRFDLSTELNSFSALYSN